MTNVPSAPQSLLAVTNLHSRALLPSEVYSPEFIEWSHEYGAYLYLVLVGPKAEVVDLQEEDDHWKMHARFHDGVAMKPRTIPVSFDILPKAGTTIDAGAIVSIDAEGRLYRMNVVEVIRLVLERELRLYGKFDEWHECTQKKFFTYRVEYIGQAYGKEGERTAAERIGQGHEKVQQILAEKVAHYPNADVALVVLDAHVQGREVSGSIDLNNSEEIAQLFAQAATEPEGPLADHGKLVTVAEAMLIRSFPELRNIQYKEFPLKDAPSLVNELTTAGLTHLGVQIDLSQSMTILVHPDEGKPPTRFLRFGVNIKTGERETLSTTSPLSWQA